MDRLKSLLVAWCVVGAVSIGGAGCNNPDSILLTIDSDAPVDQFDIYVRHNDSGQIIFHQGWNPAIDDKKQPIDLTTQKLKVALSLSKGGSFTVLVVGVAGATEGDKPAVGATQFFWAGRVNAAGVTRIDAHLLTVPPGDDTDRDLWPDSADWLGHVARAADLYKDQTLLDCDDKQTVPVHDKVRMSDSSLTPDEINPFATEQCVFDYDMNCDGKIDPCVDGDGDGDFRGSDCDDADPARHHSNPMDLYPDPPNCCGYSLGKAGTPDANTNYEGTALCPMQRCGDGIDESCRGIANDPANDTKCQIDADCDGYPPISAGGTDCDDTNPLIHPGAPKQCGSGIDYDCSGFAGCVPCDLDGDGYQRADSANGCPDSNYQASGKKADCNDYDASVHPGATAETTPITGSFTPGGKEAAADRFGLIVTALRGYCRRSFESTGAGTTPKFSFTGYVAGDADCNGTAYEGCPSAACDADGDGWPNSGAGCNPNSLPVDCNDNDPTVFPGAPENCKGTVDNNCNSSIDACTKDADGDGYDATVDCNDTNAAIHPFALELCDGIDNDCDGLTDEGNPDPAGVPLVTAGAVSWCTTSDVGECGTKKGLCVCSVSENNAKGTTSYNKARMACSGEPAGSDPNNEYSPPAYDPNKKYGKCYGAGQPAAQSCDAVTPKDEDCDHRVDAPDGNTPGTLLVKGMTCGGMPTVSGFGTGCQGGTVVGCDSSKSNPFYLFGLTAYPGGTAATKWYVCSDGTGGSALTKYPTAEQCNYIDDNCDGFLGNGGNAANGGGPGVTAATPDERDVDNDKYMACQPTATTDTTKVNGQYADCNDNDPTVYPTAPEKCDGKVNNCNIPSAKADGVDECNGNTATSTCCSQGGYACRNLTNDKNHCGNCATVCSTVSADSCGMGGMSGNCTCGNNAACSTGQLCSGGSCLTCDQDTRCGATCTDCTATTNKRCKGGATGMCVQCLTDADCGAGTYCASNNTCVTRKGKGQACNATTDCADASCTECNTTTAPGGCVDGYCCDGACNGTCQSCAIGGKLGTCSSVTNATDPGTCDAPKICNSMGMCKNNAGGACTLPSDCASGVCGGFCCSSSSCAVGITCPSTTSQKTTNCDNTGACITGSTVNCTTGYTCTTGTGCATACTCATPPCTSPNCATGYYCDGAACKQMVAGGMCTLGLQCPSGNCLTDCCTGNSTTCPASTCVQTADPAVATPNSCNNTGACVPGTPMNCANHYGCNGGACATTCTNNTTTGCTAGYWCNAGTCSTCTTNSFCGSSCTTCSGGSPKCAQTAATTYSCKACNTAADCGSGKYCDGNNTCQTAITAGTTCNTATCSYTDMAACKPCDGGGGTLAACVGSKC